MLHPCQLPVLLFDGNLVDINSLLKPSLTLGELDIIPTHLPLSHPSILSESPVFKTVSPPPLP